jgi:hypothetical protein
MESNLIKPGDVFVRGSSMFTLLKGLEKGFFLLRLEGTEFGHYIFDEIYDHYYFISIEDFVSNLLSGEMVHLSI